MTNIWGRPLEFRHSTAVQPTRVHQILYASTLRAYVCADLIGKTLVEKSSVAPHLVLTDTDAVLDLRHKLDVPVLWLAPAGASEGLEVLPATAKRGPLLGHRAYPDDVAKVRELLEGMDGLLDMVEPFGRIREAIAEARRMGVTARAA